MKKLYLFTKVPGFRVIPLIVSAVFLTCDEDKPIIPITPEYSLTDFVHFDKMKFVLRRDSLNGFSNWGEYVLCDRSLGESFTDVNGNGVYDEGIDIFIISNRPDNQDIDRNSRYTYPDEPWVPGIPFDDVDGDGEFDSIGSINDYYAYENGKPFCDYNGNGIHDDTLGFTYTLLKCSTFTSGNMIEYFFYKYPKCFYSYTSDSGKNYWLPTNSALFNSFCDDLGQPCSQPFSNPVFKISDSGLCVYIKESFGQTYIIGDILLLDSGKINLSGVAKRVIFCHSSYTDTVEFSRTNSINQSLEIGDTIFKDLLKVRFDSAIVLNTGMYIPGRFFEFYFSLELGLIAYRISVDDQQRIREYYFDIRYETLPIPMTK